MSDELNLPELNTSDFESTPSGNDTPSFSGGGSSATPPASPVDDLFEVKIDGRTFKVPREEIISGYQRQQDYTRKTMRLSERERELERVAKEHSQFQQEREQLKAFLQDRNALQEYLKQLQGFETPDSPVTAGQMQTLMERQLALREQELEQRFSHMATQLEVKQTAAQYSAEIDSTIAHALEQFPELRSVRRIERILREEVADRQPSTLEEAKQIFLEVAKEQAEGIRGFALDETKRAAVNQAKLRNGIEPPGGTGLQPTPEKFKLGSDGLRDAFLRSLTENQG